MDFVIQFGCPFALQAPWQIALFLALGAAVLTASYFSDSLVKKLLWVVAVSAWSCLAYLIVSFVPGCMWAPACL